MPPPRRQSPPHDDRMQNFTEAALPSQPPQLSLPLDFAPILLREHGLAAAHEMPRVGDRTEAGVMWSKRVPAERAWVHRWVQIDDAGSTWAAITLDCDNREAMAAGLGELPSPNFIVNTRRGAHLYWCLKNPVAKHNAARPRPLRTLARVSEYFACRAGADKAFNGLGRNPTHVEAETVFPGTPPLRTDGAEQHHPGRLATASGRLHDDWPQLRYVHDRPSLGRQLGKSRSSSIARAHGHLRRRACAVSRQGSLLLARGSRADRRPGRGVPRAVAGVGLA